MGYVGVGYWCHYSSARFYFVFVVGWLVWFKIIFTRWITFGHLSHVSLFMFYFFHVTFAFQRICPFHLIYWPCGLLTVLLYQHLSIHNKYSNIFSCIYKTNNLRALFFLIKLEIYQFCWSFQSISFLTDFSLWILFSVVMISMLTIFYYIRVTFNVMFCLCFCLVFLQ